MKKLRVGVLCRQPEELTSWQCGVLERLLDADWAEIALLGLTAPGEGPHPRPSESRALDLILRFERSRARMLRRADRSKLIRRLEKVERASIICNSGGVLDTSGSVDLEGLRGAALDVVVILESLDCAETILRIPKFGVWRLLHADDGFRREGPPGFWEVATRQPVTGATLQKLLSENGDYEVIDRGFYRTGWSYMANSSFVPEKSIVLLEKNLRLLAQDRDAPCTTAARPCEKPRGAPNLYWILRYELGFWSDIAGRLATRLARKFGYRFKMWTVFSGHGNITGADLTTVSFTIPHRDEYWADPFALKREGQIFAFFETYSYRTGVGKISYGTVVDGRIENVADALDLDYHLSYPFLIEQDGEVYMLPETHESERVEVWRATHFPDRWELHATALKGVSAADPTIFVDREENMWLFLNVSRDSFDDHCSELDIYLISGLDLAHVVPHRRNPVLIDSRIARNAGNIFYDGDRIIRPSQRNIAPTYGYGLNLSEITRLSIEEYEEQIITTIDPTFREGLVATHHASQYEDGFLIDGCFRRYRWPRKS